MALDKLKLRTPDLAECNYATLAELFPNAVTEVIDENGVIVRAIDADILRQEINAQVVSGKEERYQFTWPDKKKSILLANTPIAATLLPCREESVNFDKTENLYIEGDNLDALKLLRETYLNRVKMIYIDPPYNTGNDFIYDDDFSEEAGEFLARDGQYDQQGNRLVRNLDSNGRFHTDWLNMVYPRLRVARDLLAEDGVIFISIDDGEVGNLRKVCNDIWGENNFVCNVIWEKKFSPQNDAKWLSDTHDHILVYAKNKSKWSPNKLNRTSATNTRFQNPDNDPRGPWASSDMTVKTYSADYDYPIVTPSGRKVLPTKGRCWSMPQRKVEDLIRNNLIWFGKNGNSVPRIKTFLSNVADIGIVPTTIWKYSEVGHNQEARQEFKSIFDGDGLFDGPKPVRLLLRMMEIAANPDCVILDFFSGSATTAHAVMQLNAEDGGKRKFIMVQLPEICDESTEAAKAGYKSICEIGKERIRRAGSKIKADNPTTTQDLDIGFRVLKLDSSNMKDVFYTPDEYINQKLDFDGLIDNIKPDRTPEDLLFQVMLDLGILLSSKIEKLEIGGAAVFSVPDIRLLASFERVTEEIVTEIAKHKPYYAVFRDLGFASDATLANFEQIFAIYSPSTIRKVL